MKNEKGFTLVELIVVIVILGLLASIATTSITRYRKNVDVKEKSSLKSTISSSFSNYMLTNGKTYEFVNISKLSFSSDIAFGSNKCVQNDDDDLGTIKMIKNSNYASKFRTEEDYLKYGICKTETTQVSGSNDVTKTCKKDSSNNIVLSEETTYCIKFICNGEIVINDYDDKESICYYAR